MFSLFSLNRRYFRYVDLVSLSIIFLISCIGLAFVFSTTYSTTQPFSIFFKKQAGGLIIGFFIYFFFSITDYRILLRFGYFFYFCTLLFLLITLIKGSIGMGAQRWIDLFFFKFQPSECVKLFFPAFFVNYLLDYTSSFWKQQFFSIIFLLIITFVLILKQPDLGTALIILLSGLLLCWFAGLSHRFFVILFLTGCILSPIMWQLLHSYQKQRIAVFLGYGASHKERYQIEQSIIAVGSGGLTGKGFCKGTQNNLLFLPESRTDFIFSALGEEWGFLGCFFLIFLYCTLFFRIFYLCFLLNNINSSLLAIGLVLPSLLACIINCSMVIGLLPTVGIPLPLMSYGITNLWITFASFGWIQSICIRRSYIG